MSVMKNMLHEMNSKSGIMKDKSSEFEDKTTKNFNE
jgi:hypothetical protein